MARSSFNILFKEEQDLTNYLQKIPENITLITGRLEE